MHSQNKYGILFDCDGTILDTEPLYAQFWNEQGKLFHPEIQDFGKLILGKSLEKILDAYFQDQKELIRKRLNDYENKIKFKYVPGAHELLQSLKDNGIPAALVTSSNDDKMKRIKKQHPEFNDYFKNIITENKVTNPKPDPEGYIKGAKSVNMDPKRCIVFEDSITGIKAGKAAGCFVVGLTTSKSKEEVEKVADMVIENLSKISYEYIEKCIIPKAFN